jgi:hypothetical protein
VYIILFRKSNSWYFEIDDGDGNLLIRNKKGISSKSKSILQIIAILKLLRLDSLNKWEKESNGEKSLEIWRK